MHRAAWRQDNQFHCRHAEESNPVAVANQVAVGDRMTAFPRFRRKAIPAEHRFNQLAARTVPPQNVVPLPQSPLLEFAAGRPDLTVGPDMQGHCGERSGLNQALKSARGVQPLQAMHNASVRRPTGKRHHNSSGHRRSHRSNVWIRHTRPLKGNLEANTTIRSEHQRFWGERIFLVVIAPEETILEIGGRFSGEITVQGDRILGCHDRWNHRSCGNRCQNNRAKLEQNAAHCSPSQFQQ